MDRESNENTSTQTIVRFSRVTITVPIPTPSQACSLLKQYQESPESKHDKTISSQNQKLFSLLLRDELSKRFSELPQDIKLELSHVTRKAWDSAEQDFKDAYDMLAEDEVVKELLENQNTI